MESDATCTTTTSTTTNRRCFSSSKGSTNVELADAIMRKCRKDDVANFPPIENDEAETFAKENELAIRSSRVRGVSAKYDPSIVFAIDETLTRGTYAVLAKWFVSYANVSDLPGCVVVVGYERGSIGRCAANDRISSKRQRDHRSRSNERRFERNDDGYDGDDDSFVDLGCSSNDVDGDGPSNGRVPLVLLNASQEYPIFEFKRCTGYPIVTILITLRSSRLAYALSCDGRLDVDPRDSVQRSFRKIVDAVGYVTERYLKDLYYDETRSILPRRSAAVTGKRRFDSFERDLSTYGDGCDDDDDDDDAKRRRLREDFSKNREATVAATDRRIDIVRRRRFENGLDIDDNNYNYNDDDDDAATTIYSEYSENSEIYDEFSERAVAPPPPPYDSTRVSVFGDGAVEENVDRNAIPMDEMQTRNRRILRQMRDADRALRAESLYPSGANDRITVVRETS